MENEKPRLGLLYQALSCEETEAELLVEQTARFFAKLDISQQELRQQAAGFFQAFGLANEVKFTRKLYAFAVEHNVKFRSGNWKEEALLRAGTE